MNRFLKSQLVKIKQLHFMLLLLLISVSSPLLASPNQTHNQLSEAEKQQGWRLLFNGKDLDGWQVYGEDSGQKPWVIEQQSLKLDRDRMDILGIFGADSLVYSAEKFDNFELRLEWKISSSGNSGIFWGVESSQTGLEKAMEMQVLDNSRNYDARIDKHRAGDAYDLKAAQTDKSKPTGQWNAIRLVVKGQHIEHWMNGVMIVSFQRSGPQWEKMLAASKFADRKAYGQTQAGHILLQDHMDIVWYRNIKILRY